MQIEGFGWYALVSLVTLSARFFVFSPPFAQSFRYRYPVVVRFACSSTGFIFGRRKKTHADIRTRLCPSPTVTQIKATLSILKGGGIRLARLTCSGAHRMASPIKIWTVANQSGTAVYHLEFEPSLLYHTFGICQDIFSNFSNSSLIIVSCFSSNF